MDFASIPTWVKALFAAGLSGFAGAALDALTKSIAGGTPDYKAAFYAGIAAAVVGVLAYLKASPVSSLPEVPAKPAVDARNWK